MTDEIKDRLVQIRCDKKLYKCFSRVCSANDSDVSKEIRLFMRNCSAVEKIINTNIKDVITGDFRDKNGGKSLHCIPPLW